MFHQTISFSDLDKIYHDTLEEDMAWSPTYSMFKLWCAEKLRKNFEPAIAEEEKHPTDLFVWGRGEPADIGLTKVGGIPVWTDKDAPRKLKYVGQISLKDSLHLVPSLGGDVLSIWADDKFPYGKISIHPLDSRDVLSRSDLQLIPLVSGKDPFYGVLYRTFDVERKTWERLGEIKVDQEWDEYFSLIPWTATKIGGLSLEHEENKNVKEFICQLHSIQPHPEKVYPWVNIKDPLKIGGSSAEDYGFHTNTMVIGDLGCISIFLNRKSKIDWELTV